MALVLFFRLIDMVSCYLILPIIILTLLLFYNAFAVWFSIAFCCLSNYVLVRSLNIFIHIASSAIVLSICFMFILTYCCFNFFR